MTRLGETRHGLSSLESMAHVPNCLSSESNQNDCDGDNDDDDHFDDDDDDAADDRPQLARLMLVAMMIDKTQACTYRRLR